MKHDINTRADIEMLVNAFYERVKVDELIGPYFTVIMKVDWELHLPRMYAFWENVLFHTGSYSGNPMVRHQELHSNNPIGEDLFKRWSLLFNKTVTDLFAGENATLIKQRASSIGMIMLHKIHP